MQSYVSMEAGNTAALPLGLENNRSDHGNTAEQE